MGKSATAGAASSANGHGPATSNGSRSTANGSHVTPNGKGHATDPADITPLRRFRVGKEKIAGIFDRLKSVLCDAQSFVGRASKALVDDDLIREQKEVSAFQSQVTGLAELLMRDNMKVVFVGQTSNGKSTVINAMLHDRILPSGIGHTTNCFISVEGTDSDIPLSFPGRPKVSRRRGRLSMCRHLLMRRIRMARATQTTSSASAGRRASAAFSRKTSCLWTAPVSTLTPTLTSGSTATAAMRMCLCSSQTASRFSDARRAIFSSR
eukprot:Opistho-2@39654